MKTVVNFGEIMLRLSPPRQERFFQSPVLGATLIIIIVSLTNKHG